MQNDIPSSSQTSPSQRVGAGRGILLTLVVVALGVALFVFLKKNPIEGAKKPRAITIAQAGDFFLYAPLYIAVDAGLFEEHGVRVSLTTTGGDEKTWAAVVSGNAKFGVADPTFVAVSDARGQPGKVIASIVNGVPFWGVTLKEGIKDIKAGKGLEPYRIATFPAPSTAYALQHKMFVDAGLKPNIREGAFGTLMAMLHADQADIALELEPNVSQAAANGARVVYSLADVYGDFAITGLTTTPELLQNDAELARSVVCALQKATDYARRNPEQTLNLLAKRFPDIKREIAKEALNRVLAAKIIPDKVSISTEAWNKAIALRKNSGDVKAPKEMAAYVDNSHAEWAQTHCRLP